MHQEAQNVCGMGMGLIDGTVRNRPELSGYVTPHFNDKLFALEQIHANSCLVWIGCKTSPVCSISCVNVTPCRIQTCSCALLLAGPVAIGLHE